MKINSASRRETRFSIKIQIKQVILHMTCFLHRAAKYADLQIFKICKDKIFGNLNQIFYLQLFGFLEGAGKKYHCMIFRADLNSLKVLSVNFLAYRLNK